jgi:hypothetical protein
VIVMVWSDAGEFASVGRVLGIITIVAIVGVVGFVDLFLDGSLVVDERSR